MAAVAGVNLSIDKGTDFSIALKIKTDGAAINLTGYGFSCTMRKHHTALVGYGFSTTLLSPVSSGVVRLDMHKSITSELPIGRYVWDLLITNPDGATTKSAEGNIIVKGSSS